MLHLKALLSFISAGSIIRWIFKKRQERLENRILKYFEEEDDWHSADGIWGTVYIRTLWRGVPANVVFPVGDLSLWQKAKWRFKATPYYIRFWFKRLCLLPPKHRIASTLQDMWKRGLLTKASFNPKFYRMKH